MLARGAGTDGPLTADAAEPKSCADYRAAGLPCRAAQKGPGSVRESMKWLQGLAAIIIDPVRCPATAAEFSEYEYERDPRTGEVLPGYPDVNNHHIDAVRYAVEGVEKERKLKCVAHVGAAHVRPAAWRKRKSAEGRGPGMPGPYRVAMKKGEDDLQSYLEQAFGKSDVTSVKMRAAVREWFDLYYGVPRAGEDTAPRVAALIVGKLCRTVFAEYETRLPPEAPDPLRRSLSALNAAAKTAMQYALVGGECLLKPVPRDGAFDFAAIRRDCYVPLARDAHGSLLAVGTMERHSVDGRQYALLERRTAGADGLTIETRLFELNGQTLGRCVPLATLPACAELVPQLVLPGVQGVGLAVLKTPLMNCVDGSTDAVSIYAPAAGLLHALARCEEQLNAEFANGASRVFASEDLLRPDAQGRRALQDDLFVGLPDDPANVGVTVYSPALREGSYLARKQDLLRGCESLLGLRRGILSEVETPPSRARRRRSPQRRWTTT
ncbi:hypothetical protein NIA69_05065 [Gemmiger formicilis]|nr:hypothetical protein [Gemmiger formicilis]